MDAFLNSPGAEPKLKETFLNIIRLPCFIVIIGEKIHVSQLLAVLERFFPSLFAYAYIISHFIILRLPEFRTGKLIKKV